MPTVDVASTPWEGLQRRFGGPDQDGATFKSAFEDALRRVFAADLSISIASDDEGVSVRHATPEGDENVQEGSRTTTPVQSHEAQRVDLPLGPLTTEPVRDGQPESSIDARSQSADHASASAADGRDRLRMISLRSNLTGLPPVVWLRCADGDRHIVIGVTPIRTWRWIG